ncbi:MAG TPA: cardiolipin synthase [Roseiflexaceae bacterium]|nr:cardiolipin synthase [Roseiflexaceae bacterium]
MNWAEIAALVYLVSLVIPFIMLVFVPVNRRPSSATAWLLLIFMFPYIGTAIFLLLGNSKLSVRRRLQQRAMDDLIRKEMAAMCQRPDLAPLLDPRIPPRSEPFVHLNTNLSGLPAFGGNTVELCADYAGTIRAITEEIERAQRFIHVEYFILCRDASTEPFFQALERAVRRGVTVRVLLDHLGSLLYPGYRALMRWMREAGIEAHVMLPVRIFDNEWSRADLRNHRKIVVVDGAVGFTGSQNIIDRTYHKRKNLRRGLVYDELVARVTGPVVMQLQAVFITDWYSETGVLLDRAAAPELWDIPPTAGGSLCQVLPSGPGHDNENNLKLFASLIHAARRRIVICNPYFVPDESLMTAITSAAQRDVEVHLVLSEISDQFLVYHAQRSYYEALLRAGVQVWLYRAPAMLHSKTISIDDDIAVLGSSNMDIRSFELDLEVTLVVYDPHVVRALRQVEALYRSRARPLQLEEWRRRSRLTQFVDNMARLTSALQ